MTPQESKIFQEIINRSQARQDENEDLRAENERLRRANALCVKFFESDERNLWSLNEDGATTNGDFNDGQDFEEFLEGLRNPKPLHFCRHPECDERCPCSNYGGDGDQCPECDGAGCCDRYGCKDKSAGIVVDECGDSLQDNPAVQAYLACLAVDKPELAEYLRARAK